MRVASHAEHFHDHQPDEVCHCGEHHSHVPVQLRQTLVGMVFIVNSFLVDWLVERDGTVSGFSALVGAVILGLPIVWVAFKDLRGGALNTNVLVVPIPAFMVEGFRPEPQ